MDMLERLRNRRRNREIIESLYDSILSAARDPLLFADFGVPDTVMGRFESLSLHVFLFMRRCRSQPELTLVARDVVERFMLDLDISIRELGVGDPSVPKRMRGLAGMFYERVAAYEGPLSSIDAADVKPALADAFKGRILPKNAPQAHGTHLAEAVVRRASALEPLSSDDILAGRIDFEVER